MKIFCASCCMACMAFMFGCASSSESPYRDPSEVRGSGTEFTSYDFQQSAIAMVDSMLSNAELEKCIKSQFADGRLPVIAVMPIENRTYKIFELRSMSKSIESKLVASGKFRFVDRDAEKLLLAEMIHDTESALTGDAGATDFGNHFRADYLLSGELNEIRDTYGETRESYYKLTMKLINKKTGSIDWSGEKEIRKVSTRPVVGW